MQPDIDAILDALESASREAELLVAGHPAALLEQTPGSGRWSSSQCLAHMAVTNFKYIVAMRYALKPSLHLHDLQRSGPVRPGLPTRWFLSNMEPPVRRRFRAHGAVLPPSFVKARAALKEFQHSQEAVRELLLECRHLDLNKIRFENPFVPILRFTVGAGFLIITAHERRHLWQAAQACAAVAPSEE
ncbi:MAG: DinB family protein [Acidobacteria bacterium]|nr:DinB family protein [Acidobacteriota bacterium]